jgi:hypothetical protein
MPKKRVRRSVVVVDRKLQFGIALRIIGWFGYYFVLFCALSVGGPLLLASLSGTPDFTLENALADLLAFGERLLIPLFLTCLCVVLHVMSILNRVAGPAYRIWSNLREIEEGDLSGDLKLRPNDFLQDLAQTYNETLSVLRGDFRALKEQVRALESRLLEASESGTADERALASMRSRVSELSGLLDMYILSEEERPAKATAAGERPAESVAPEEITAP